MENRIFYNKQIIKQIIKQMKKLVAVNFIIAFVMILGSCGTSNNVVSNRLISKRKYTKGFHINKRSHEKSSKDEVLANNDVEESKAEDKKKSIFFKESSKSDDKSIVVVLEEFEVENSTEEIENNAVHITTSDAPIEDSDVVNDEEIIEVTTENERAEDIKESVTSVKASSVDTGDPLMLIIAILLCLILPPVAIAVFDGISTWFWVDLILFLIAIGGFFLFGGLAGIAGLASIIIAFLVVFDVI
jgi:uncharacterized membrane protein YqaE (UPF0057 family)